MLGASPILLIGETHGREAHQNWQADLLLQLAIEGRYPAVVMEHLRPEMAAVLDEFRALNPERAAGLAVALEWWDTGWPAWSFYEPVFDRIWQLKLEVRAGDFDLAVMEDLAEQLAATPNTNDQSQTLINLPLWNEPRLLESVLSPEAVATSWRETIERSHCGFLEPERAPLLVARQMIRDENMGQAVADTALQSPDGVVLFAGSAHTRLSRGVAYHLLELGFASDDILSVGLIEHETDDPWPPTDPTLLDYDLIVRTPHSGKRGACERLQDLGLVPAADQPTSSR